MQKHNRFARGSGCYRCQNCKRQTRDTGGDNGNLQLCPECYEIAGIQNDIWDKRDPDGSLQLEMERLKAIVRTKGGVL